jgi:GTPase SAR1 family protein
MKTIGIVGPAGSGKTCLIRLTMKEEEMEFEKKYYPTIGVGKYEVTTTRKVKVYDFAGQEPLDSLKIDDWMKCDLIVICYDQLIETKPRFVDHYIQACEKTDKPYLLAQLKCDTDHDWEQSKFSIKSQNSLSSFWQVVFEKLDSKK